MATKETKIIKSGKYLFKEGEHGDELYIIQTGRIRIFRKVHDKTHELGEFSRGSVIGEMALFDNKPRSASAIAITDCRIVNIDQDHFQKYLNTIPQWLSSIILMIIKRLRDTTQRIKDDSLDEYLIASVAWMLTLVIAKHPQKIAGIQCVGVDVANRVIRKILDIDIDLLLKCYDELTKKELIKIKNGLVTPLHMEQLDLYVQYQNYGIYGALGIDIPESAMHLLCAIFSYCRKIGAIHTREVALDIEIFSTTYAEKTHTSPAENDLKVLLENNLINAADNHDTENIPAKVVFDKDTIQTLVTKFELIKAIK